MSWFAVSLTAMASVPTDIADALSIGDCATVLSQITHPAVDDERLVAAYCFERIGNDEAATSVLETWHEPLLEPYADLLRARALAGLGRADEGLTVLEAARLPSELEPDSRLLRARLLAAAGRETESDVELTSLLAVTRLADEARFELGRNAEKRANIQAAVEAYRRVWATSSRGNWATDAASRLDALGSPVPEFSTEAGRALVKERVATLRAAERHGDALALFEKLVGQTPSGQALLALAHLQLDARKYGTARDTFRAALGPPESATGNADDLFDYALTTARAGDYDTAATLYRRVEKLHPTSKEADFASFKLGYMEFDRGNLVASRAAFATHLGRYSESKHLDEALWFSARAAWRLGDIGAAVADLDALIERRPNSSLVPGAAYWKARARGRLGDVAAEKAELEALIRRWPVTGYAWYASLLTGKSFRTTDVVPRPAWPEPFVTRPEVQRAEALLALGLEPWARAELHAIVEEARAAGREAALAAAHALAAAGDYSRAKQLAGPYCSAPWKGGDAVAQQACTPMPEASIVRSIAEQYELDPLLPFGIMNAESALQPEVTSVAGARGLMQIMPAEGDRLHAERFGSTDGYLPDLLYEAPYNAALGTTELGLKSRALAHTLGGTDLPAIIASYNGGEEAVRRWLASYETPPEFDEFAEDVGYTETRQYIRRVLGFVMAYRWVYGDSPPVTP